MPNRNKGRKAFSFWQAMASHPPALIRLYARRANGREVTAITAEEIAITSGLPLSRIRAISTQVTWDGVSLPEAERFCAACRFDPTNPRDRNRERAYARKCRLPNRPRYQWLVKHPLFQSEFRPLIQILAKSPLASSLVFQKQESRTQS